MTRLREALDGIAAEAPPVNLADAAIAGHRRRRRATLALAAVATVAVVGGASAAVSLPGRWAADAAAPQDAAVVPDLPDGPVGALTYAYQTLCEVDYISKQQATVDCGSVEWRVVTTTGRTYRMPQALAYNVNDRPVPVAISRDGRKLAYYSRDAQAHVVRDMVTGTEVTSPVTVPEEKIGIGSTLVLSDDGRHLVFDPRVGSKYPGVLIDTRTGARATLNGKYETVGIKDGHVELIRYIKTDLWLRPVAGGGKPVRFDGVFIAFSEVSPDGRTVAAQDMADRRSHKQTLTLLDVKTGRTLRKVEINGMPKAFGMDGTTVWRSASEVTVTYTNSQGRFGYGVDVKTGKARLLTRYGDGRRMRMLVLPGTESGNH
ncbi:hypothetical protein [Nonomuraea insulae]|uniref:WD40 repeat domain-containing protein n=1 Tax=Nonomuraea insulae TaxID=1616787 RepID=A0ABW1DD44_9ACTN